MRIVIGSDHAGFPLKATIIEHIKSLGHEVHDAGSYDPEPVDFPDIAKTVTSSIIDGPDGLRHRRRRLDCGEQG
jgi:ribose 5-phosphate isomerase B